MQTGSYVNGKWFQPKSNRLVRNINPADTDDIIAEFPAATVEMFEKAIAAAQGAFERLEQNTGARARPRALARRRHRAAARR